MALVWLMRAIGRLPLPVLHWLGGVLGVLTYVFSTKTRQRTQANLAQAKIIPEWRTVMRVLAEASKGALELAIAWTRSPEHIVSLFTQTHGWEHVQAAMNEGKGLLFITPHLGSYDLGGRFISEQLPFALTAMYRPPKIKRLEPIMNAGRVRGKGRTAPTTLQGVKQLMQALRAGEATILLPDQVPHEGEGVWADFFDRPAYTMTLAAKLARQPHVAPLFFCAQRLHGRGFALHIAPLSGSLTGDKQHDTRLINENVEAWVRRFPHQYLFSYNRYKGRAPESVKAA